MSRSDIFQTVWIGRPHQSPLVGRARECNLFLQLLEEIEKAAHRVLGGDYFDPWSWSISPLARSDLHLSEDECIPQCLLLTGEAGIGKTRLAEEYGRLAGEGGWRVLWCQGSEQTEKSPYSLWLNLFRTALALDIAYPQEVQEVLLPLLETSSPLVSSDSPKAVLSGRESPFWLAGSEKLRVWEAASLLFACMTRHAPILIVLDDFGWSDSLSRELLAYLARSIAGSPILLVGTLRTFAVADDTPADTWRETLADLARKHLVEMIPVGSLDSRSLDLLLDLLGGPLSDEDHISIRENSAGNPYFCEELVRYFTGDSRKQTGNQESAVPPSLAGVLDEHIASVADFCQHMLSKAAVLGGNFTVNILAAMEEVVSPRLEEDLFQALEEALRAQIVTEIITKENGEIGVCYQFWHPLLANHLYERIPRQERRRFHQQAADVLCARSGKEEDAAHILTHVLRGDVLPHQVIQYGWLAGKRAYQLQAYPEAERAFLLVLEHLRGHTVLPPASLDQWNCADLVDLSGTSGVISWQGMLWELLGECLMVQGRYEDACEFYEQVLGLLQEQTAGSVQSDASLAQYQALLWREKGFTFRYRGDRVQAWTCYEEGKRILSDAGIIGGPAWASFHYQAGSLYWQEGRYDLALEEAEKALLLFEQSIIISSKGTSTTHLQEIISPSLPLSRSRRTLCGDPVDVGRTKLLAGTLLALVGRSKEALDHLRSALEIFEQCHCQREVMITCDNLGDLLLRKAEFEQAREHLYRAKHIAEQIGDNLSLAITLGNLGLIAARCGELTNGERLHGLAYHQAEQVREPVFLSFCASTQGLLLYQQGRGEDAIACIQQAFRVGRDFSICHATALVKLCWMRVMHILLYHEETLDLSSGYCQCQGCQRLVGSVETSIHRVLAYQELEAETQAEGLVLLAYTALLQGKGEEAMARTQLAYDEAQKHHLIWLVMICEQLLAQGEALQGFYTQADQLFKKARCLFQQHNMRLEEARTLFHYGKMLISWSSEPGKLTISEQNEKRQQGLSLLKLAHRLACECQATLDERRIAWLLDQAQLPVASQ